MIKSNKVGSVLKVKVESIEHLSGRKSRIDKWQLMKLAITELQHKILELSLQKNYFSKKIPYTLDFHTINNILYNIDSILTK